MSACRATDSSSAQPPPSPSQTPHASIAPLAQQIPAASRAPGLWQQSPRASTAVPLPPQTPQASTAEPAAQQRPSPSSVGEDEFSPVVPVLPPLPGQHFPSASTTPLGQHSRETESATPEGQFGGTSQKAPDAPSRQTQRPPPGPWVASHSPRPEQAAEGPREACAAQKSHATAPQACEEAGGCRFEELEEELPLRRHSLAGSTAPSVARTHSTVRVATPPPPHSTEQGDHRPTRQAAGAQGAVLHSRCVAGLREASQDEPPPQPALLRETPPPQRAEQGPQGPTSHPPAPPELLLLLHPENARALAAAMALPHAPGGSSAPDGDEQRTVSSLKRPDVAADDCCCEGRRSAKRSVALAALTHSAPSGEGTAASDAPKSTAAAAAAGEEEEDLLSPP